MRRERHCSLILVERLSVELGNAVYGLYATCPSYNKLQGNSAFNAALTILLHDELGTLAFNDLVVSTRTEERLRRSSQVRHRHAISIFERSLLEYIIAGTPYIYMQVQ